MDKKIKECVMTIQSRDSEIIDQKNHIKTLMDEIERLKSEALHGNRAQSELEQMIQELQ